MFNGITGFVDKKDKTKKKENNKKIEDIKFQNNNLNNKSNVKVPENYHKLPGMEGVYFEILDD